MKLFQFYWTGFNVSSSEITQIVSNWAGHDDVIDYSVDNWLAVFISYYLIKLKQKENKHISYTVASSI